MNRDVTGRISTTSVFLSPTLEYFSDHMKTNMETLHLCAWEKIIRPHEDVTCLFMGEDYRPHDDQHGDVTSLFMREDYRPHEDVTFLFMREDYRPHEDQHGDVTSLFMGKDY
jgi:hypothetical protein